MGTKAPQPPPIDPLTGKIMRPNATATPPPPPPKVFLSQIFENMMPLPLGTNYPHLVCIYSDGKNITRTSTGGPSMEIQESSQVFININKICTVGTVGET